MSSYTRMGRPPTPPNKPIVTITLRVPAELKQYLIETSDALDMPINEYMITLINRDAAPSTNSTP